jgi:hypothetical protein
MHMEVNLPDPFTAEHFLSIELLSYFHLRSCIMDLCSPTHKSVERLSCLFLASVSKVGLP